MEGKEVFLTSKPSQPKLFSPILWAKENCPTPPLFRPLFLPFLFNQMVENTYFLSTFLFLLFSPFKQTLMLYIKHIPRLTSNFGYLQELKED